MFAQTKYLWMLVSVSAVFVVSLSWSPIPSARNLFLITSSASHFSIDHVVETSFVETDLPNHPPIPTNLDEIKDLIGYPSTAKNAGIEGNVVLRVLVNEQGEYVKHSVVESFHPLLRIPCELHAPLIEFKPASRKGEIAKGWVRIPFSFELPPSSPE